MIDALDNEILLTWSRIRVMLQDRHGFYPKASLDRQFDKLNRLEVEFQRPLHAWEDDGGR